MKEIKIRSARHTDFEDILNIYHPYITSSSISFETEIPSLQDFSSRITQTLRQWPWLVAHDGDRCLGYAYASPHRTRPAYCWSVETSVYVALENQGHGIGRRLYAVLLKILKYQKFENALAGIALPNPASVRLHKSFGFNKIGIYPKVGYKLGAWHDVAWCSLSLQDSVSAPQKPVPYSTIDSDTRHLLCQPQNSVD